MSRSKLSLALAALLVLPSCSPSEEQKQNAGQVRDAVMAGLADPFVSDVIGVEEKHLATDFWTQGASSDVLKSADEIRAMNADSINTDPTMFDLAAFPDSLSGEEVKKRLRSISNVPSYPRIYMNGNGVSEADFTAYEAMLGEGAVADNVPLRFALAVRRTPMRTYPTMDRLFSEGVANFDIDRFQESTLFPTDAVVILHESTDGDWYLVQSYHYIAWVQKKDLAIGPREAILDYKAADNFLVVTGAKVHTVYNPELKSVSEVQLDMGVRLPLDRPEALAHNLYGQNPYLGHMVVLPTRLDDGSLEFRHALIQRNQDVHIGYLPFTEENIIRQAFKFLGERYGWGHSYNGRDCTGFVSEVYRSMGILLPRNSGDQGKSAIGQNVRFEKGTPRADKHDVLRAAKVGDLVYIPGHVMMILGQDGREPYVIHDVTGLNYLGDDGEIYKGTLNGVSITPLLTLQSSIERTYVDAVYTVKSIR
ncbi:C40 family peptidase [Kordiimonas aestuarii]|uniref:C40 family peptidase n=1 Tax=Kordiimonas aestuarii TaxID=1005925 RepID=UPI0021CFC191|nr:SH3 domain-containing protein [Kordiimonas aestuarii]